MTAVDLVSWNTAGASAPNDEAHADRAALSIHQMQCDIVVLQEVNALLFEHLERSVPRDNLVCSPRPSPDGSFEALCMVIPPGSAVTVLSHENLVLTEDQSHPLSPVLDAKYPRIAQILKVNTNGRVLTLVNVHLDKRGARSRISAQSLIRRRLTEGTACVVVGDFNESSTGPIGRALGEAGFLPARISGASIPGPYGVVVDHAFGRFLVELTGSYKRIANISDHPSLEVRAVVDPAE